ncbi:MAG: aromatic ring-hydroxylating dioxygenase subunit alpha [Sphingomonadales bacterium]|nr:aromatic ring-hydroxylating dioxygenase subunit alpha [Sphingomonadales bacterium]
MNLHAPAYAPPAQDGLDWLGTRPIPAAPYYDHQWFADEVEAIFKRCWIHVGHVCELAQPDAFIRRELEFARASLLITRGPDGAIRAFHNACTHRGTQLVTDESEGRARKFSCKYHMWTFANDGALLSAPDFGQFHVEKPACALKRVHCEVVAGMIFVNLARRPEQDLATWLGELGDQMAALPVATATHITEYVYDIDANWKLTYDNFQENYHLRFIHTRTGAAGLGGDNPFGYPTEYGFFGPHRTQAIWDNPEPGITPFQGFGYGRVARALIDRGIHPTGPKKYFALFPAMFLFGSSQQPFSHTVYPIGPERSRGVFRLYWNGADANPSERFAREFSSMGLRDIHSEDRAVILAGQRGLSSGALEHIHFQTQESLCRHLFNEVEARVLAYRAEHGGARA